MEQSTNIHPKLSVIIPVYNAERFLLEAVESVSSQPCKDLEIILVNDGSIDSSEIICLELEKQDSRIHYFPKEHSGVSDTRNFGMAQAKGEFIAFLDSDDKWVCDVYNEEVNTKLTDEYDIISFGQYHCNEAGIIQGEALFPEKIVPNNPYSRIDALWTSFASNFYSKKLLEENNLSFNINYAYFEDRCFQTKASITAKNVLQINKVLFLYRNNLTSSSHISDEKNYRVQMKLVVDELYQYYLDTIKPINGFLCERFAYMFLDLIIPFCGICSNFEEWFSLFLKDKRFDLIKQEYIEGRINLQKKHIDMINSIDDHPKNYYSQMKRQLRLVSLRRYIYRKIKKIKS